jgi:hypothetical protein
MRDMQQYAQDRLAELVSDAIQAVENEEGDFDAESYCPYYAQQVACINDYESDFGDDAEDICGDQTFKATEWQQAQTAYAYAIAYCAFSSHFADAKKELIEVLESFEDLAQSTLKTSEEIMVQLSMSCSLGWAAHNRELEDGTMVFESGQLDGCNGIELEVSGVWVSCVVNPSVEVQA